MHRRQSQGSRGVCVIMSHAAAMRYVGHDYALLVSLCHVNPLFGDSMAYNIQSMSELLFYENPGFTDRRRRLMDRC